MTWQLSRGPSTLASTCANPSCTCSSSSSSSNRSACCLHPSLLPHMSELHGEHISRCAGEVQQPSMISSLHEAVWVQEAVWAQGQFGHMRHTHVSCLPGICCHQGHKKQSVAAATAQTRRTHATRQFASLVCDVNV